jgi:hypothetical protein
MAGRNAPSSQFACMSAPNPVRRAARNPRRIITFESKTVTAAFARVSAILPIQSTNVIGAMSTIVPTLTMPAAGSRSTS